MDLSSLSNDELIARLELLATKERRASLAVLYHLIELDRRELYRELGYSSLFDYCTRKLKFSEGGAQRRIVAARLLREHPELGELLIQGQVTLSSLSTAAQGLKKELTQVKEIIGKSQREVERLVAKAQPVLKPRETIKPLFVEPLKAPLIPLRPPEERFSLHFSVSKEVYAQFEEAKNRLSNSLRGHLTAEAVFGKLLELYLRPRAHSAEARIGAGRYIPVAVRQALWERDQGQCTYVAPDGTRCTARRHLHFDHIVPFALGGKTEMGNLRLRCFAHNQLYAKECFGREFRKASQ